MPRKKQPAQSASEQNDSLVRLQKLLASHGHGSRRACEQFIIDGRVEVDGKVVQQLGTRVDPSKQQITLDGERLIQPKLQYFMLNKPPGVVSTTKDPSGRIRVIDLIATNSRVYNVGRLDKSSEGLILVTNDGDLANKLTHPRYGVEKKYNVLVVGCPTREQLESLKRGVYLAEARVRVSSVRIKKRQRDGTWLEIILHEGRNREIRRVLARIGHKVIQLRRVAIGPLALADLPLGSYRKLTTSEVRKLKQAAVSASRARNNKLQVKSVKDQLASPTVVSLPGTAARGRKKAVRASHKHAKSPIKANKKKTATTRKSTSNVRNNSTGSRKVGKR